MNPIELFRVAVVMVVVAVVALLTAQPIRAATINEVRLERAQARYLTFEEGLQPHDYDDCQSMRDYVDLLLAVGRAMGHTNDPENADWRAERETVLTFRYHACYIDEPDEPFEPYTGWPPSTTPDAEIADPIIGTACGPYIIGTDEVDFSPMPPPPDC